MLGRLAKFWLADEGLHHADAEVQLVAANTVGGAPRLVARIPLHAIVLCAASEYFAALLSPKWGPSPGRDDSSSATRRAVVALPAEDAGCVAGLLMLLRCIYTGDLKLLSQDVAAVLVAPPTPTDGIDATGTRSALAAQLQDMLAASSSCWQALYVRVIALADQYGVQDVVEVAVTRLTRLFSFQLDWPAVEAVLWLPPAVANNERLTKLRTMALTCIQQGIRNLDATLASPPGRRMLQHMPPDALVAVLSSDALAVSCENSVLAAIEVWLDGPVAASLAQHWMSSHGTGAATPVAAGSTAQEAASQAPSGVTLPTMLQQLLGTVRLPLCSGGFLAAAVQRMPWMCAVFGQPELDNLRLLQRYYSGTPDACYSLSMELLTAGRTCPWSVPLRKAATAASIQAAANTPRDPGSRRQGLRVITRLSAIRRLLAGGHGITLEAIVQGGFCWEVSLVALLPAITISGDNNGNSSSSSRQLCLSVVARPAWAAELARFCPVAQGSSASSSSSVSVEPDTIGPACGFVVARHGDSAAVTQTALAQLSASSRCSQGQGGCGCEAVAAIAAAKTAAAIARHAPAGAPRAAGALVSSSPCCPLDVVVGVWLAAAASDAALQQVVSGAQVHPSASHTACLLPWDAGAGEARGLVAVDVRRITGGDADNGSSNLIVPACGGGVYLGLAADWDDALWSRLAPSGELHWAVGLRMLSD